MPKTFFDFSEMKIGCLHQNGFTNTVKRNQFKTILVELLTALELFSTYDFEDQAEEVDNCHEVKVEYMKTRIGELLGWKKQEINDLERKQIWQIPFGKEARLFGILKKIRYQGATNSFQALILDPNHKVYRPSSKENFPIIENSICLFTEKDECWEVIKQKKLTKKSKKS